MNYEYYSTSDAGAEAPTIDSETETGVLNYTHIDGWCVRSEIR